MEVQVFRAPVTVTFCKPVHTMHKSERKRVLPAVMGFLTMLLWIMLKLGKCCDLGQY